MNSYSSDWNKETVMANATRLLHITQELAVDAVPKYTKKQYARLGFGSSSIGILEESEEVSLVQEAYEIAWKYFNLTLQYVPIAKTSLKLHTHHGVLGNFIGTIVQDGFVLIGDTQGVYTCSNSGFMKASWSAPRVTAVLRHPNSAEAHTGRVLTGTRTCTIESGWAKDLNSMTDVERVSATEPITIKLSASRWFLTWYPKQKYMMIQKSDYSEEFCEYPSEVQWSYRVAPSSYRDFVFQQEDWSSISTDIDATINFINQYPTERVQTDYAYEVPNKLDGFDWVKVEGSLPEYKCPPMLVKYFNYSVKGAMFVGDSSLDENNLYTEILESIDDPRKVYGYVVFESASKPMTMAYVQLEFFAIPLDELFPIRENALYCRSYNFPKSKAHSSGMYLDESPTAVTWLYSAKDHPDILVPSIQPLPRLLVGGVEYGLITNIEPARNVQGLVMLPILPGINSKLEELFNDEPDFYEHNISMLGVRYDEEGTAYAICVQESNNLRDWTNSLSNQSQTYQSKVRLIKNTANGLDWSPLLKFLKYEPSHDGLFIIPVFNLDSYGFYTQLAKRTLPLGGITSGKRVYRAVLKEHDDGPEPVRFRSWVYSQKDGQYEFMLTQPTLDHGFYKPPTPSDTLKFRKTKDVFPT